MKCLLASFQPTIFSYTDLPVFRDTTVTSYIPESRDICALESVTDPRNRVTYSGHIVRASQATTVCHKLSSLDRHPRWLSGKESVCRCRRCRFHLWVRMIPWRRKWQPTPGILAWKSPWTDEPGGYSPWGCKELDMTERLSTDTHTGD